MNEPFHIEHVGPVDSKSKFADDDAEDVEDSRAGRTEHPTEPAEGPDDPEYTGEVPR